MFVSKQFTQHLSKCEKRGAISREVRLCSNYKFSNVEESRNRSTQNSKEWKKKKKKSSLNLISYVHEKRFLLFGAMCIEIILNLFFASLYFRTDEFIPTSFTAPGYTKKLKNREPSGTAPFSAENNGGQRSRTKSQQLSQTFLMSLFLHCFSCIFTFTVTCKCNSCSFGYLVLG